MGDSRSKWLALAPLAFATAILITAFITYVPQKAFRVERFEPVANGVTAVFPQGWAFFTKSPVTPRFIAYAVNRGTYVSPSDLVQVGFHNGFGLNRAYRNAQSESEWLERALINEPMKECVSADTFECFDKLGEQPSFFLRNALKEPLLCGDLFVAKRSPVPWTWLTLTDENIRTVEVTRIDISC